MTTEPGDKQAGLEDFTAGTTTESITRTVRFPLESSEAKNDLVRDGIDDFQEMAAFMADVMPFYPPHRWGGRDTHQYRHITDEFPDDRRTVKATIAREAAHHVAEAFASWNERGRDGNSPTFGGGDYLVLSHQDIDIVENERGYGLKSGFIPYKPIWFHLGGGAYQQEYAEAIGNGDASAGRAELILEDDGSLYCHLNVTSEVEVYVADEVSTTVGVDLGENVLFAAAVTNADGEVETVDMESGREYRHHREQLKRQREKLMAEGDLRGVKSARTHYENYTDYITNVASRRIVDLAEDHAPSVIRLEDLTYYRETAEDPIHDWPFAEIQQKIAYKATEVGIPVEVVNPRHTSITCRKCGQATKEFRDGVDFHCRRCGYEVHADVNAAINIAESDT